MDNIDLNHPLVSLFMAAHQIKSDKVKEDTKQVKDSSKEHLSKKLDEFGKFYEKTGFIQTKSNLQTVYLFALTMIGIERGKSDLEILVCVQVAFGYDQLQDALEDGLSSGTPIASLANQVWDIFDEQNR